MSDSVHNDFLSKLDFLLAGRDRYPWGFSIGLTRGTINRIFKGQMPGTDTLIAISKAENVRLDWLLLGIGEPFNVNHCTSDTECAALLSAFMDEAWSVCFVTDSKRRAIVLTQPGQLQISDRWVDYTILEVISGPFSTLTYERLRSCEKDSYALKSGDLFKVETDRHRFDELISGKLGTWKIVGSPDALLGNAKQMAVGDLAKPTVIAESPAEFGAGKEEQLIQTFRELSNSDRDKALQIISVLKASN